MFWKEKYNLWQVRRAVEPGVFKKELWQKLGQEFDSLYLLRPVSFIFRPAVFTSLVIFILVVLGGVGTSVYAYTSPTVNQNHPLFVLKKGLEKAEIALAPTPEKKLEVSLKHRQKRLQEIARLKDKSSAVEKTLSDFNKSEDEILSKAQNVISLEKQDKIIEKIGEQNVEAVKKLQDIKMKADVQGQEKMNQIIEKQKKRAENILEKEQQQQQKISDRQKAKLEKAKEEIKN